MNGYATYAILALVTPLVVAVVGYFAASRVIPGYGRISFTKTRGRMTATNGPQASDDTALASRVRVVATDIPVRLDHLPWSRFHTRIIVAFGITWCLIGWMSTLVGPLD